MKVQRLVAVAALLSVLVTSAAQAAPRKTSPAPTGIFSATSLPAGEYRLINDKKGLEYQVSIGGGKIMVKDIHPLSGKPETTVVTPHNQPVAASPVSAPAGPAPGTPPVTGVPPAAVPGAPVDPNMAAALAAQQAQAGGKSSKLESLIKSQAQRQIKRHGSKIERQIKNMIKL